MSDPAIQAARKRNKRKKKKAKSEGGSEGLGDGGEKVPKVGRVGSNLNPTSGPLTVTCSRLHRSFLPVRYVVYMMRCGHSVVVGL